MLHVGLDLSRRRLDVCVLDGAGELVAETAAPPDADGLRSLAGRFGGGRVRAVIESMNGARFVHDTLEEHGWEVLVADAKKVKGLAPLACKTDRIDARVLAELSWRDLVPAIWLPDPSIRRERELARFRLHLVRHRTTLKNRVHATLITFGHPCPVSDLFGFAGRELLDRLAIPDPWRRNVDVALSVIDELELQIAALTHELKRQGADHRYIPLLVTAPGLGWINAYTIASEIGDSSASRRRRSFAATRDCARASCSPALPTAADRSQSTGRATCAGRSSKPRSTRASTRFTGSATSGPNGASAASADPRSPRSTSPASSPPRSGTCSPATNPSLRQTPLFV
jgi:transposase